MKIKKKPIILTVLIIGVLSISALFICDAIVKKESENKLFDNIHTTPKTKVALLLGTSKYLLNGKPNNYFSNRIDATIALYQQGKFSRILISGDNSRKSYNEPEDMKKELVSKGIPDSCIYLDFAGFRTYDSVVRMNKIFGQSEFIIISQKFHNERAVYIALELGLNAYGFNAKEVTMFYGLKTNIREKFARVKLFIDLIFNIEPKFLGERVYIK